MCAFIQRTVASLKERIEDMERLKQRLSTVQSEKERAVQDAQRFATDVKAAQAEIAHQRVCDTCLSL